MQLDQLRRRDFITLVGGAAVAWPRAAHAQRPAEPLIGVLSSRSLDDSKEMLAALAQGLSVQGFVEHHNVAIEYRWAEGQYDRLPALAAELVRRQAAVILAVGSVPSPLAAKAATSTIPIVFIVGGDPIKFGLVASLARPGGNVTGVSILSGPLTAKRLELLRELVPQASVVACLVNPNSPEAESQLTDIRAATRAARTSSTPPSQDWSDSGPVGSSSATMHSLSSVVNNWSGWRRAMPFRRYTSCASSPRWAG